MGENGFFSENDLKELIFDIVLFVITFVIIGSYWITYQSMSAMLSRTTDLMIWLNIIFLMFATMLPFAFKMTNVYETNIYAYGFYCAVQIFAGFMFFCIWIHALKAKLISPDKPIDRDIIHLTHFSTTVIPVVFIISFVISIYSLEPALGIPTIIIPASVVMRFVFRKNKDLYLTD